MLKNALIGLTLIAVYLVVFVVHVETKYEGPGTSSGIDDLKVQSAFFDSKSNILILVTADHWKKLHLPNDTLMKWADFKPGKPSANQTQSMEKVAIVANQGAAFGFYGSGGFAQVRQGENAQIPSGYRSALYSGPPSVDAKDWVSSYILVTQAKQPDGQYGTQLFYNPKARSVAFYTVDGAFTVYGPSYLALCIALPVAFSKLSAATSRGLFILAFLLHGLSSLFILALVGMGEAWSGQGSAHGFPLIFLIIGTAILFVLWGIQKLRCVPDLQSPKT